jgi:hypothetical protein
MKSPTDSGDLPRRFTSLLRTVHSDGEIHTIDAIDDEGRAWWMIIDLEDPDYESEWFQLTPLPTHTEQP